MTEARVHASDEDSAGVGGDGVDGSDGVGGPEAGSGGGPADPGGPAGSGGSGGPAGPGGPDGATGSSAGAGAVLFGIVREVVLVLVVALGLSLLIKTFLVQAFFIPSESMQNTLLVGDRVLVSKLTPGPFDLQRGDVVVFADPGGWLPPAPDLPESTARHAVRSTLTFVGLLPANSDEHLIKRLIGLPGDTVACCDAQGRLTVNGVPIDEPYVYPGDRPSEKTFKVTVPAGHIWVMGDHRSDSLDSRFHDNGSVPVTDVVGRTFVTVWPFDRFRVLHHPTSTFSKVPRP